MIEYTIIKKICVIVNKVLFCNEIILSILSIAQYNASMNFFEPNTMDISSYRYERHLETQNVHKVQFKCNNTFCIHMWSKIIIVFKTYFYVY